jgi:hypothetical protein
MIYHGPLGSCCKDLKDAMNVSQHSMFRVESNGVLYLTIGYSDTQEGKGWWFDQAVIFCPFCGKQLQAKEEIQQKGQKK